jgi:hypothetical protein
MTAVGSLAAAEQQHQQQHVMVLVCLVSPPGTHPVYLTEVYRLPVVPPLRQALLLVTHVIIC